MLSGGVCTLATSVRLTVRNPWRDQWTFDHILTTSALRRGLRVLSAHITWVLSAGGHYSTTVE
eukprot:3312419-Prymnesium_polylepis.1